MEKLSQACPAAPGLARGWVTASGGTLFKDRPSLPSHRSPLAKLLGSLLERGPQREQGTELGE